MPGHVLAMIVQYLHTGDIASEDCHDRDALDRLLDVARAAHSMNHSALFADCVRHLLDIVDQNQAMLCPVFEAFFGDASVVDGSSLLTPLLQHVRSNPMACLLLPDLGSDFSVHPYHALSIAGKVNMGAVTNAYLAAVDDLRPPVATGSGVAEPVGVLELSGRALETLIAEDKKKKKVMLSAAAASAAKGGGPNAAAAASLAASLSAATAAALSGDKRGEGMIIHEEFWFYVVWYWALHNPHMNSLPSSHDGTTDLDNTGVHGNNIKELSIEAIARRTHATQIIDLLDSRRMRAAFLLRVVEPTALMSLSKLCEGYKAHATHSLTTGHSKSSMSANVNMSHSVNAAAEWTRKRLRFRQRGVKT